MPEGELSQEFLEDQALHQLPALFVVDQSEKFLIDLI